MDEFGLLTGPQSWLQDRVRGHVVICLLAACLTWHLRVALAR